MMGDRHMLRLGLIALLATPAMSQDSLPLSELMSATHVHGIGPGSGGPDSLILATHNGLWAVDMASGTATRLGDSQDDFMGYSAVLSSPGTAFASSHPATGGNIGVIRTEDAGQSWIHVSDGLDGPVDFHNMEVSRADPAVIYGIGHDRRVQRSVNGGVTWEVMGEAPEKLIDIATAPSDATQVYAATEAGLFLSPDGGASWQPVIEGAPVSTVDTGPDGMVRAVDLANGLVTLVEGGEITQVSADLPDGYLLFLSTTSVDPFRLAALTAKGRLVASQDGGISGTDALGGD